MAPKNKAGTMLINLPPRIQKESAPPDPGTSPSASSADRKNEADESLFHGLLQNLYDAALITDLNGNIINVNVRALDFLLYDQAELRRLRIFNIISGADESLLQTILQNLGGQRFTNIEGYCIRKDGSIFPTEIVANRLQYGREYQLCFFVRDITRRKQIEEDLRKSEARNRALLNAIPDLMFRIGKDGAILDLKAATDTTWPVSSNESLGRNVSHLFPQQAQQFMQHIQQVLQSHETRIFEYQQQVLGNPCYYEVRIVVSGEAEVLAIVRDITLRKEAEQAEEERLNRDLEIARQIQQHLLPPTFPKVGNLQFGAINIPALKVGGDYYDFVQIDPNHWGFAIADVSGKGISGALIMAMCRSALRAKAPGNLSPSQALREVNRIIHPDMGEDLFISMLYGVMNLSKHEFTVCRAGHSPLLIYRRETGREEVVSPKGMALGIDNGTIFDSILQEQRITLQNGDAMIFYTDGVTEALNEAGQEFGRAQLTEAVRACADQSAEEITKSIEQRVRRFVGNHPQSDDITLMVIRI